MAGKTVQIVRTTNRSITLRVYDGKRTKTVRVGGWWKVDGKNKLKFYISGKCSVLSGRKWLVFYGSWFVDRDNYLAYEYDSHLGRGRIVLKGKFLLFSDNYFLYRLERSDSVLKIRGGLKGKRSIKDGVIKYEVMVEGRNYKRRSVVVVQGRVEVLPGGEEVVIAIRYGERLEKVRLRLSKRVKKGIRVFIEGSASNKERRVVAGVRMRF